jgi:hypothetical protein
MSSLTERQAEYITILSSYEYSKKEDEADIVNFLKDRNKKDISQLTKWEASELIEILLKRPTQYVFVCGLKAILDKKDVNCNNVLGDIEGCMHACPDEEIRGDINNCPYYQGQQRLVIE